MSVEAPPPPVVLGSAVETTLSLVASVTVVEVERLAGVEGWEVDSPAVVLLSAEDVVASLSAGLGGRVVVLTPMRRTHFHLASRFSLRASNGPSGGDAIGTLFAQT